MMTLVKRIIRRLVRVIRPSKSTAGAARPAPDRSQPTEASPRPEQEEPQSQHSEVTAPSHNERSSTKSAETNLAPVESPAKSIEQETEQDKVAKHRLRATKGLLKFVAKNGGNCSLADLHSHSETRFFIGHKAFSDLMEDLVAEELLGYDHATSIATLLDKGQTLISS